MVWCPQVVAGGAVSAALFAAFAAVSGGDAAAAEAAIAARAAQLLSDMAGSSGAVLEEVGGGSEREQLGGASVLPCRGGLLTELAALAADADSSLLHGDGGSRDEEVRSDASWWLGEVEACTKVRGLCGGEGAHAVRPCRGVCLRDRRCAHMLPCRRCCPALPPCCLRRRRQ